MTRLHTVRSYTRKAPEPHGPAYRETHNRLRLEVALMRLEPELSEVIDSALSRFTQEQREHDAQVM